MGKFLYKVPSGRAWIGLPHHLIDALLGAMCPFLGFLPFVALDVVVD